MLKTIELLISLGEVFAGLAYVAMGVIFVIQATYTPSPGRMIFRLWGAALFMVAGAEEIADSVFQEGDGVVVYAIHGLLTTLQVITTGMALWALFRSGMFLRDMQQDN